MPVKWLKWSKIGIYTLLKKGYSGAMVIFGMILQNTYESLGLLKGKICILLSCIPYEICIYRGFIGDLNLEQWMIV